jgi:hypothetical protein
VGVTVFPVLDVTTGAPVFILISSRYSRIKEHQTKVAKAFHHPGTEPYFTACLIQFTFTQPFSLTVGITYAMEESPS